MISSVCFYYAILIESDLGLGCRTTITAYFFSSTLSFFIFLPCYWFDQMICAKKQKPIQNLSLFWHFFCLSLVLLSTFFPPLFPFIASSCLDHLFPTLHCGCGLTSCSGRGQLHGEGKILTRILITYPAQQGHFKLRYKTTSFISFMGHY